ncbi:MAG: PAS domain S-box protein [Candidatus Dormibacteraeota bacterium]|nr:PAS domain S-box protein [Candidatus Dormibacteraeota bacterium]MBO0761217.1 PAS domain S-box protein [Candidatus Dormibacteraeota bacterium]
MSYKPRGYRRDGYRRYTAKLGHSIPAELRTLAADGPGPAGPSVPEPPSHEEQGGGPEGERRVGPFRLRRLLARGGTSSVYAATMDPGHEQELALKVLDPSLTGRRGFLERFESTLDRVIRQRHPGLLPILRFGTFDGYTCVATMLVSGGTLRDRLARGPVEPREAVVLLRRIAAALNAANESGLVHGDVAPGNILFSGTNEPLLAGFGTAPVHLGISVGTPGYLSPEQAQGLVADRRTDVYSLGATAFEMLTGTAPYSYDSVPDLLIATVHTPVPSARQRRPQLPPEVDSILGRAMAKRPEDRQGSVVELVGELGALTWELSSIMNIDLSSSLTGGTGYAFDPTQVTDSETEFDRTASKLQELFKAAITAAVLVDERGYVVGWNGRATELFGWSSEQAAGRSLQSTIIPPQYREAHERGVRRYLATGEATVIGQAIQITAMNNLGKEFPIELSIAHAARSTSRALFLGFIRDMTAEKQTEKLAEMNAAVDSMLSAGGALESVGPRVLEAVGSTLGWACGSFWTLDPRGRGLVCEAFWNPTPGAYREFERATREAFCGPGQDVAGRVLAEGQPCWVEDVLQEPDLPRALPALRGGLHAAVSVPIVQFGSVTAALELVATDSRPIELEVLNNLYEVGRKLGRLRSRQPADKPRRGIRWLFS